MIFQTTPERDGRNGEPTLPTGKVEGPEMLQTGRLRRSEDSRATSFFQCQPERLRTMFVSSLDGRRGKYPLLPRDSKVSRNAIEARYRAQT